MYFLGLDIGSTMTKGVILKEDKIVARLVGPTGPEHRKLANKVVEQLINQAGIDLSDIDYLVATGYGRLSVPFADRQITEITCHAAGVQWLFPTAKTIIDIGGQDSKVIKLKNKSMQFLMNDKCAAGTGRFLEMVADALELRLDEIGGLSLKAKASVEISNTCTVFAEQEVISRLVEGTPPEDILAGIHMSVAERIYKMACRLNIENDVVLTGGGAKNVGLIHAFEKKLKTKILVPEEPLLTGALGAAILASRDMAKQPKGANIREKPRCLEEIILTDFR